METFHSSSNTALINSRGKQLLIPASAKCTQVKADGCAERCAEYTNIIHFINRRSCWWKKKWSRRGKSGKKNVTKKKGEQFWLGAKNASWCEKKSEYAYLSTNICMPLANTRYSVCTKTTSLLTDWTWYVRSSIESIYYKTGICTYRENTSPV